MDDDNADWLSAADEPAPAEAAAPQAAAAAAGGAPEEGGEKAGDAEVDTREVAEDEYLDPDKLILFKHWIRPRFLQYRYLYEYRQSYYDDITEVLERRRRGYRRDIPRPQTWAERILRTHRNPFYKMMEFDRHLEDIKLVTRSELSGVFHKYYSRDNFNKRYSQLLY